MSKAAAALVLCAVVLRPAWAQQPGPASKPPAAPAESRQGPSQGPASQQAAVDTTILAPQEIGTISPGQSRTGRLEAGDYTMSDGTWADIWYFNATAGQRVVIELRSRAFDAYLQLLTPWGDKLADNDDCGRRLDQRSDSCIEYTIRDPGRYQIVVNNFGDEPRSGVYTLTFR